MRASLLYDGHSDYRVRINGTTVGRVRRSDDVWTAALLTDEGFEPLLGNYRRRDAAYLDVVQAWEAEHQPGAPS